MPKRLKSSHNRSRKPRRQSATRSRLSWINWKKLALASFILLVLFAMYVLYLDFTLREQFDGKRWALPAKVYARPLELYVGKPLSLSELDNELKLSSYRASSADRSEPGTYYRSGDTFHLVTRAFDFWDGHQPPRYVELSIENDFITQLRDYRDQNDIDIVRLEPAVMGRIYPAHHEDRILIKLDEVPDILIKALIAIEDRQFYSHHGVNPRAIARAMIANLRAGGVVQGGSTLTQQLIKNFYLSQERSLWRKFNEAIMALLLEWHYDKNDILQAYLNEIYLGQDSQRAIHGIGLASRFYFDKQMHELNLEHSATLVAMIRGPVYYNPWRNPQRLLKRRNHILQVMLDQQLISSYQASRAMAAPLGVIKRAGSGLSDYPAFMDLVRRHLQRDYRAEDLNSEGLQIFTTFDPMVQQQAEQAMQQRLPVLDRQRGLKGSLQGAMIVTRVANAEVLAVVGDREPRFAGFNRVLDARRQIGSLMKPAVYLSAIQQANRFTLSSIIEDKPITLKTPQGDTWSPRNYSGESNGDISLADALIHSYNQATVRLGMTVGYESITKTLAGLGVEKDIPPYPAMTLGAVGMTPYEVAQMYQTYANEGLITPLRVIREVLNVNGQPLRRYSLQADQKIESASVMIINSAMSEVTRQGTAKSLQWMMPPGLDVAGKTGTTNDTRDSWFAGFSGEHVIVSWLGTDDNQATGLTGSSGALPIWADVMKNIRTRPLLKQESDTLEYHWVDLHSGMLSQEGCEGSAYLAYHPGTAPTGHVDCR